MSFYTFPFRQLSRLFRPHKRHQAADLSRIEPSYSQGFAHYPFCHLRRSTTQAVNSIMTPKPPTMPTLIDMVASLNPDRGRRRTEAEHGPSEFFTFMGIDASLKCPSFAEHILFFGGDEWQCSFNPTDDASKLVSHRVSPPDGLRTQFEGPLNSENKTTISIVPCDAWVEPEIADECLIKHSTQVSIEPGATFQMRCCRSNTRRDTADYTLVYPVIQGRTEFEPSFWVSKNSKVTVHPVFDQPKCYHG